jgi:magnesium transporter
MISIYKNNKNGLAELDTPEKGSWIKVIDPTEDEKALLRTLGVDDDYLTYSLDPDERARIEKDGYLLILLKIPEFQSENVGVPYDTTTLGIIITEHHLITVCRRPNAILDRLLNRSKEGFSPARHYRFVLQILLQTANLYLEYLHQITHQVDILEEKLQKSTENKEVLELLRYQKSLTLFTTALMSNELMMKRLQNLPISKEFPEDGELLEDVLTEMQQAIEMTDIQSNILSGMMDAFASIISNNLNRVMKFLASVTIILSLPTLVASLYGMNVKLPLTNAPYAFPLILVGSILISVIVAIFFWRRDWL